MATCVQKVAEAMGDRLDPQMVQYVAKQINPEGAVAASVAQRAADFQQRSEYIANKMKQNAAINVRLYFEAMDGLRANWKKHEIKGLEAAITGVMNQRVGARDSVALAQHALARQWMGGLVTDLESLKLDREFASGVHDLDTLRALRELGQKSPDFSGLSLDAVHLAKTIRKWQEDSRIRQNKAGAWISKLDDYMVMQTHDPYRLIKSTPDKWVADIDPKLDWPRIEAQQGPIANKAEWLFEVYKGLASGVHMKQAGAINTSGFNPPASLAKKLSQSRVLHFKSADDFHAYNLDYGARSLRESIFIELRHGAHNAALMEKFGPNPRALYERIVKGVEADINARGDWEELRKFNEATQEQGALNKRFVEITGEVNIPVSHAWARWLSNARALQSLSKLGGAVIASISDLATVVDTLTFNGNSFFGSLIETVSMPVSGLSKAESRIRASTHGVFADSMVAEIGRIGGIDDHSSGFFTNQLRRFFKLNMLDWWTNALRGSFTDSLMHNMGMRAKGDFNSLPADLKVSLSMYGLAEPEWAAMRRSVEVIEGREVMLMDRMPAAVGEKYRNFISDQAYTAVLEPDAGSRALMRQGQRSGTFMGETIRTVMQFKSYPIGFSRQIIGRRINQIADPATRTSGMYGLVQLMVLTTGLGYVALAAKDGIKGRKPRSIFLDNGKLDKKVFLKSMLQGGGAGIYGDYLFGQYDRFGRSPLESLAGPTVSTASDIVRVFSKTGQQALTGEVPDTGADAYRLLLNNIPYANLFYARAAMDQMFLYEMQEAINPGSISRMESRLSSEGTEWMTIPGTDRSLRPTAALQ